MGEKIVHKYTPTDHFYPLTFGDGHVDQGLSVLALSRHSHLEGVQTCDQLKTRYTDI